MTPVLETPYLLVGDNFRMRVELNKFVLTNAKRLYQRICRDLTIAPTCVTQINEPNILAFCCRGFKHKMYYRTIKDKKYRNTSQTTIRDVLPTITIITLPTLASRSSIACPHHAQFTSC
jgi:hypothetical protein